MHNVIHCNTLQHRAEHCNKWHLSCSGLAAAAAAAGPAAADPVPAARPVVLAANSGEYICVCGKFCCKCKRKHPCHTQNVHFCVYLVGLLLSGGGIVIRLPTLSRGLSAL